MKTRASILALAATAALGLSALTPTDASAWGFHGGGFRGGYHFGHFGHWGGFGHYGYGWRGYGFRHAYWGGYRWWPRWRFYPRPIIYGGLGGGAAFAATGPAPAAAPPAPAPQAPANCLTKSYLPNGTVMFADMCTQEQGMGPANGGQQPQGQPGS